MNGAARPTRVRWKIFLLLLLLLVTITYVDRASLSVAMPRIAAEFGLTPTQKGPPSVLALFGAWMCYNCLSNRAVEHELPVQSGDEKPEAISDTAIRNGLHDAPERPHDSRFF